MKMLTDLYPYQQDAVNKLSRVKVGALYMEMGTGKTRTALELIKRRMDAGKVKQTLWLCPFSNVRDLPELLSEHVEGFENCRIAGIESLSASLRLYGDLMNYVAAAPTYLVVDESLLVKNPQAYRTQRITSIAEKCSYKLILNGTPVSRNEADLFAQWYILDWRILGYKSYWSFAANHLEYDPERPGRIVRTLNTEYLARKIAPYTFEAEKADVLRLPNKRYHKRRFAMTEEQREHYDDISEELLSQLDDRRPNTIYRLFGALRGITSGFSISNKGEHLIRHRMYDPEDNPRIDCLMSVIEDIGGEQAVIYCQYTQEIHDIISILGDKATPFYGELSPAQRQRNKTDFKNGKAQYLVANKSCAQFGLNLQFAHVGIFYGNDWDWGTRMQAEDRLHRVGQTERVQIYDIVAAKTIDEAILRCLSRKESLADKLKAAVRANNADIKSIINGGDYDG